ncbi:MAG: BTB/POZ domain-containing protein KCTD2 [Desulfovibrio sp.]|jgi:hypothetical protein|nr:BTB/POZ domain-containing protein KCTD2 [Desulfovibrio sp.]
MKNILVILGVLFILAGASIAEAACTFEEAQQKAMAFTTQAQALAQKNPQKYAAIMQDLQPQLMSIQQNPNDIDKICKFYDDAIAKLQSTP